MWIVRVVCSDPECAEESEVIVSHLDEVDESVCECGGCFVVLAVASFEPLALTAMRSR
jgi:hypothetical protein